MTPENEIVDTIPDSTGKELIPIKEMSIRVPALLKQEAADLAKAEKAYDDLPAITDEKTKDESFRFRDKVKLALETYKGHRMPWTRRLDDIVKQFTGLEKGFQTIVDDINADADRWAAEELAKARKIQAANDKKLRDDQEKIRMAGVIRELLLGRVNTFLDGVRNAAGGLVTALTKKNYEETKTRLSSTPKWTNSMELHYFELPEFTVDQEQFVEIARVELEFHKKQYFEQARQILDDTVGILEVALTNKAEATRMQEATAQEAKDKQEKAIDELQAQTEGEVAIAQISIERPLEPAVKVKMKIEISGGKNAGWIAIIAFWYEHDPDAKIKDLSKKTFQQCKAFAEKLVNHDGTMLTHPNVKYIEDVKAK